MACALHKNPNLKSKSKIYCSQTIVQTVNLSPNAFLWNVQLCWIYNVKINISNQIFFAHIFTRYKEVSFTETKYDPA